MLSNYSAEVEKLAIRHSSFSMICFNIYTSPVYFIMLSRTCNNAVDFQRHAAYLVKRDKSFNEKQEEMAQ